MLPLVAPWSRTLSGLIRANIRVMSYPLAACTDWLAGWLSFLCWCVVGVWVHCPLHICMCGLRSAPVDSTLFQWVCGTPACPCRPVVAPRVTVSRIGRSAFSVFFCAASTSMGFSSITWCSFFHWSSFSRATYITVPKVLARPVLNRWPAKALSVNPSGNRLLSPPHPSPVLRGRKLGIR